MAVDGAAEHGQQARVIVFLQHPLGFGVTQQQHVAAGFLLHRVAGQRAGEGHGVRRVDDDQLFHVLRMHRGEGPCNGAAPVMGDEDAGFVFTPRLQMLDQLSQVFQQRLDAIGLNAFGLVGKIVAAQVEGDGAVIAAEFLKLAAPALPELGEAVDEQHQRRIGRPFGDAVQTDAVDRGEEVFHQGDSLAMETQR